MPLYGLPPIMRRVTRCDAMEIVGNFTGPVPQIFKKVCWKLSSHAKLNNIIAICVPIFLIYQNHLHIHQNKPSDKEKEMRKGF